MRTITSNISQPGRRSYFRVVAMLVFLYSVSMSAVASTVTQTFIVEDIRVEGLQRISQGTFFTYLPIKVGERVDEAKSALIIRTLYKQGVFSDIQLGQDGQILVIYVKERSVINTVTITGNDLIETDIIEAAIKSVGLVKGEVINQSLLNDIEQDLENQYLAMGRYASDIVVGLTELDNNRVDVTIEIFEGDVAKISDIILVGNKAYDDETLLDLFSLSTSSVLSIITRNDHYSKQKLAGDLERLRSHYLDNGYLHFRIDSTQVTLSPDKQRVFITVNVTEGEQYTISDISVAGEHIVPAHALLAGIEKHVKVGDIFSRRNISEATKFIMEQLGDKGYIFANVNPVPDINEETLEVSLSFFVDPGRRVYVRRINFLGNLKTADDVLRREMRQPEGGWASTTKIERSKTRLERLGYFKEVAVETEPVPGFPDLIDVHYNVLEQPSGNINFGLGFSQKDGVLLNFSVNQSNFLGTGNRVNVTVNNSKANTVYNASVTDPYLTHSGISGTARLHYKSIDAKKNRTSDYEQKTLGGLLSLGVPISETERALLGFEYENTKLDVEEDNVSEQVKRFYVDNGQNVEDDDEITFDTLKLNASISHDSRNRAVFADSGSYHTLMGEIALPGGDLNYLKLSYRLQHYFPLSAFFSSLEHWVLKFRGEISYGDGYGESESLPFFENFYAGGVGDVRGFRDNSIGPREILVQEVIRKEEDGLDSDGKKKFKNVPTGFDRIVVGNPIGGNIKVLGGLDVIFPTPFISDSKSVRTSFFVDFGNLIDTDFDFDEENINQQPGKERSVSDFDSIADFRLSVGAMATWITQFGPLTFSLGVPLLKQSEDEVQIFQFSFGSML